MSDRDPGRGTEGEVTTFGERVRAERKREGLTQREVAMRAGITPQYLNDVERDRRACPFETADRIAQAMNCDVMVLDPIVRVPLSQVKPGWEVSA